MENCNLVRHPTCQFQSDKTWLDCQYHDLECTSIKKPDQIESEMEDPPVNYTEEILDRIQGSMFGMALGDALGAHVEFRPRGYLVENPVIDLQGGGTWGLQKGQFTDDTSMALCLANSLIARREFNCYDQLVRYQWWFIHGYMSSTGQCFDIGSATRQSLREFQNRQQTSAQQNNIPIHDMDFLSDSDLIQNFDVFCSREGVAGNGALMRLAPVPLFFYKHPIQAVKLAGISGQITHGDQKAYDACRYYGALIVAALNGESKEQLLDKDFYLKHQSWFDGEELHQDIIKIIQGSYQKQHGYDDGIRGKGYIVDALEAALWAFWIDDNSFTKGALAAVNLGDDTDTTAAIYGQLAGAFYGFNNLPDQWIQQVYANKFIQTLSKWIAYEGQRQTIENMSKLPLPPLQKINLTMSNDNDPELNQDQQTTSLGTSVDTQPQHDQTPTTTNDLTSDDNQKTTPTINYDHVKPQKDYTPSPSTSPIGEIPQNDEKITPSTISHHSQPQDGEEATSSTTPDHEKPQDNETAAPPTSPTVQELQENEKIILTTDLDHDESQDDEKETSSTTSEHSKLEDDYTATPPTSPAAEKTQDSEKIVRTACPDYAQPQDDRKATLPITPEYVRTQYNEKVLPRTTSADAKVQDDQNVLPATPVYARPHEVFMATSTIPNDVQREEDQNLITSTFNYGKSHKNLTSSPSSLQRADFDENLTYQYDEPSQLSSRTSDTIPIYGSSYQHQSYRSEPTPRPIPTIPHRVETRTDTRNYNYHSKPFSSESPSSRWSNNRPINLNKNLLWWTIRDVTHWVESFGENYSNYVNSFEKDFIDGFRLYNFINDEVLIEYGVTNEDHRKNILNAIQQLRKDFLSERRYR